MALGNGSSGLITEFRECSVALITPHHARVACGIFCVHSFQLWRYRSCNHKQIRITIIVQIDNPSAPAAETAFGAETGHLGHVVEFSLAIIAIETRGLID